MTTCSNVFFSWNEEGREKKLKCWVLCENIISSSLFCRRSYKIALMRSSFLFAGVMRARKSLGHMMISIPYKPWLWRNYTFTGRFSLLRSAISILIYAQKKKRICSLRHGKMSWRRQPGKRTVISWKRGKRWAGMMTVAGPFLFRPMHWNDVLSLNWIFEWIFCRVVAIKSRKQLQLTEWKADQFASLFSDLIERVSLASHDSILVSLIWFKSGKAQKAFLMIKISFVPNRCHCPMSLGNLTEATSFFLLFSRSSPSAGSWRVRNSF